eukprot:1323034-Lingulodinium_polyedra.AAC.1
MQKRPPVLRAYSGMLAGGTDEELEEAFADADTLLLEVLQSTSMPGTWAGLGKAKCRWTSTGTE